MSEHVNHIIEYGNMNEKIVECDYILNSSDTLRENLLPSQEMKAEGENSAAQRL